MRLCIKISTPTIYRRYLGIRYKLTREPGRATRCDPGGPQRLSWSFFLAAVLKWTGMPPPAGGMGRTLRKCEDLKCEEAKCEECVGLGCWVGMLGCWVVMLG